MALNWSLVFVMTLAVAGCAFHSAPGENHDFARLDGTAALDGVYLNAGDPEAYLSKLLWGEKRVEALGSGRLIPHEEIALMAVTSFDGSIRVSAVAGGCVVHEREYVEGQDFRLSDGRILLHKETALLYRGPGDMLLGPSWLEEEIGLDLRGDGKYRRRSWGGGLLMLFIPVAGSDTSDIRFERVADQAFERCTSD
jgi:hypothetical protein